jgi:signal transduction histidine kinase
MSDLTFILIYFFYGLAFYSMGLAILLEYSQCSDRRLRHALRPLAAFGLIHGAHEWIEMFFLTGAFPMLNAEGLLFDAVRIGILAFSFLSLAAFGASLLAPNDRFRRLSLLVPLVMSAIWAFGLLVMRGKYAGGELFAVADVWTRYVLAVPAAMVACLGLVVQQRRFRQAGMAQFGRDSLYAAIAFFWYGIIGQTFTRTSPLWPSTVINQSLFIEIFGVPVQLLRATAALVAALFVIRFLRSFEVETANRIAALQAARLEEAQRREALRGDLLRRVVEAQEAERQRIARELHDETGQSLTALGLGLRGIATTLVQDQGKAESKLKQLEQLVGEALTELQRLITDLRPSHLDDLGLAATLRWYAGQVQERSGINVNVDVQGEMHLLPIEARTALFRIAQEAVNNTVKHAGASNIWIVLSFTDRSVSVQVRDDGSGFDGNITSMKSRTSWGLIGMRERAALLGGELKIQSKPGIGTTIEVTIPYDQWEKAGENGNSRSAGG